VKIIFWMSLAGVLYSYAGYPIVMWILARLRPRPWKTDSISPSVSVVLAVHNGIAMLPRKIQFLLDLDYSNIKEIVIVSDGSTDGTAELLARQSPSRLSAIILKEHVSYWSATLPIQGLVAWLENLFCAMIATTPPLKQLAESIGDMSSGSENARLSSTLRLEFMEDSTPFAVNFLFPSLRD
jgi:hypothetical protein